MIPKSHIIQTGYIYQHKNGNRYEVIGFAKMQIKQRWYNSIMYFPETMVKTYRKGKITKVYHQSSIFVRKATDFRKKFNLLKG